MRFPHDMHIHTFWSGDASKKGTVANYVAAGKERGLKKMGFAEHFWDDRVEGAFPFYVPQTFAKVSQTRDEIKAMGDCGVELCFGCEVEYDPVHKAPALTPEIAEQFDFVIVPNSHSHETMPKEYYADKAKHKDFILGAFNDIISCDVSRYVCGIAHPFSLCRCEYPCDDLVCLISDDEFKDLFARTAEKGIALEFNIGSFMGGLGRLGLELEQAGDCQLMRMFRIAKAEGCKFFFGTDAHGLGHLEGLDLMDPLADCLGLTEDDIAPFARVR